MSRRKGRRLLLVLGCVGGALVVCLAAFLLYLFGYIPWNHARNLTLNASPHELLAEADYLANLGNWEKARPYFAKAERLYAERGDQRDALYAKISCVEADVEKGSYTKAACYLSAQLQNPIVQNDDRLKLRCLAVKGIVNLNTNTIDAEHDWSEALNVAKTLNDATWQNRATGWLGILDFVNGNGSGAGRKVIGALTECALHHDIGGEDVFLTYMSDGLTQDGMPSKGLAAANKALAIMRTNPDAPYPYRADLAKIAALTELKRYDEARSLIATALNHARQAGILGAEADLLREAGELEERAGNDSRAEEYYRQTATVASEANLPRIEGESMFRLTDLYRKEGNLPEAEKCIAQGIQAVRQVEAPYELPHYLAVEAELKEANQEYRDADGLFSEAADLVDGMLVNAPTPMLQSSLVGTMSEIYVEHFQLAVRALKNDSEAFEIVERARGRGMADALQDHRQLRTEAVSDTNLAEIQITNLQRQLRQQQTSAERAQLLDELDEAETTLAGAEYERNQFRRLVPSRPVSLNNLEHSVGSDEVVLEYVLSNPHSYCLVITRDGEKVRTLASRSQIDKMIGQYLADVTTKRPADAAAKQLYAWLLGTCLTG